MDEEIKTAEKEEPVRDKKVKKGFAGRIVVWLMIIIGVFSLVTATANFICYRTLLARVDEYETVENDDAVLPTTDKDKNTVFVTDRDLKIMDLSDIHIGSGWLSVKKDRMAVNAIAAMVTAEKPDLVVLSGDLDYPVPFQSGTVNNAYGHKVVIALMEKLGVSWTVVFGNHDAEVYSVYNLESVSGYYSDESLEHCLYKEGDEDVDGYGNYVIHVRNTAGDLTQELVFMDSNSYDSSDPFGIKWNYDNIHQNQVNWYKEVITKAQKENPDVKSLVFIHIPPQEMQDAYNEYIENGSEDTADVKYVSGVIKAADPYVYCPYKDDKFFETALELGSTQAIFFAHDHRNNMVLNYKGINLAYNYSVDYLALKGISKEAAQRGCSIISVKPDGSYTQEHKNYYENYYDSALYHNDVAQ